jgi:predicted Zn finger-like uncharacterized protein
MIIQCKQCRTKFRFDDAHMQGSGIWLRCSRCGHVYFQENPYAKKPALDSIVEPEPVLESKFVAAEEKVLPPEEHADSPQETPSVFHRDEHGLKSLDKIMVARKRTREGIDLDIEKPQEKIFSEETQQTEETKENEETEILEEDEKPINKKSPGKGLGRTFKIAAWSVFVILIIPSFIYFFALPQYGEQLVNNGEYLVKKFNEYRGVSEPVTSGIFINQMVKLQDVRYRRINNYILGQIGVLEGNAVNRADYPLSRIQVKGEIVDAYSIVLGERASYAGNILTDEELINLSEEEILMKILRPEGLNNSNDKIMPGGQIPFMIVFPNEPSGVIKTTVVTIGAERLL